MPIRKTPCQACPYRIDTPSGVWEAEEYLKLAEYDKPTSEQPPGMFLCHDADRETVVCRGWWDVHSKQTHECDLLAVRLGLAFGHLTVADLETPPCDVPMYGSGAEACEAGLAEIDCPSPEAQAMALKIKKRHNL
jgi:hypothetical protein